MKEVLLGQQLASICSSWNSFLDRHSHIAGAENAGINRWSLKFRDSRAEDAFMRSRSQQLTSTVGKACLLVIVISLVLLLLIISSTWDQDDRMIWRYERIKACLLIFIISLALFTNVCVKTKCWLTSDSAKELFLTLTIIVGAASVVCIDSWYLYRLSGIEPSPSNLPKDHVSSDSRILLGLYGVISVTHAAMPVRWHSLVPLEIASVSLYTACVLLGSPEAASSHFNLFMLASLVMVAASGKRTMEYFERILFAKFLHEKRIRFQTEFQLEMLGPSKSQQEVDATSDTTAKIFDSAETHGILTNKLEEIAVIGHAEQWLIDSVELRIVRDCILGTGGFGIVVEGLFCEKPVAVKIAKRLDACGSVKSVIDIGNEVRVLRRVRHPNIVLFHGAYVDPQQCDLALVLERVSGALLTAYVHKAISSSTLLNDRQLQQLNFGICHALIYLHSRKPPIVHGDLKPDNIAVESSDLGPRPKLLDFGLSRILMSDARTKGRTVAWAAPEVLLHPQDLARTCSDIYAHGYIVYFILTGRRPREGQSRHHVMKSARRGMELPLRWPLQCPFLKECRLLVAQSVQHECDARPKIDEVFRRLVQIMSPTTMISNLGERPSADVFYGVRQNCSKTESSVILDRKPNQLIEEHVEMHGDAFKETRAGQEDKACQLQDSFPLLHSIFVDCSVFGFQVPVRNCSVCSSSLPAVPNRITLNLPACLALWIKSDCFTRLKDAMHSFLNTTSNGMDPYPTGVRNLKFSTDLISSYAGGNLFTADASFCEVIGEMQAQATREGLSSSSSMDIPKSDVLVRVAFTNLCFSRTRVSVTRRTSSMDSDLAPIAEGHCCDKLEL